MKKSAFVSSDAPAAISRRLPALPWPLPYRPDSIRRALRETARSDSLSETWAQNAVDHPLHNMYHCTAVSRMVRFEAPEDEILIYTDGSCLDRNNFVDTSIRRAGCAVVFGTKRPRWGPSMHSRAIMFALEKYGPTGEFYPPTSNRAELRAAIAALECRQWNGED